MVGTNGIAVGTTVNCTDGTVLRFTGWNTNTDGTGTGYGPGDVITVNENTVLYGQWEESAAAVRIEKLVAGALGDRDREFGFTYKIGNAATVEFTLKHNDEYTIENVPLGSTVTVTEQDCSQSGYTTSYQIDGADAVSLAARTAVLLLFAYLFFSRAFLLAQAPGNDMFPAVKDGDLLIGYRLQRDFSKNDVVVYTAEGERRTGRVLGRASDVITIDGSGTLLVNGTAQAGEIMYPTYPEEGLGYPYTVPDGCVFILGDYRTQSQDSRDFGAIALDDVEAKVITVIRRRSL